MTGWPSAKIRRTIAATDASAVATSASLPTSSILPRGKAGLAVRRNLSASAIFFFPCRPLASGSRRSEHKTTRKLRLTQNAQRASWFPLHSGAGAPPRNMTDEALRETLAVAFERRGSDFSRPPQISAGSTARRPSHFCARSVKDLWRGTSGDVLILSGTGRPAPRESFRKCEKAAHSGRADRSSRGRSKPCSISRSRVPRHSSVACGGNAVTGKTVAVRAK